MTFLTHYFQLIYHITCGVSMEVNILSHTLNRMQTFLHVIVDKLYNKAYGRQKRNKAILEGPLTLSHCRFPFVFSDISEKPGAIVLIILQQHA